MTQPTLFEAARDLPEPPQFDGLITEGTDAAWAVFSPDRRYRYLLGRRWGSPYQSVMAWCMLNPSVAGALADDPTIRKCRGFALSRGCGGIIVCNLAALIATDPRELLHAADAVGERNHEMIAWAFQSTRLAHRVLAWGRMPSKGVRHRLDRSAFLARSGGVRWCYGKTQDGEPRHPLMLAYATPLVSMADGRPFP